MENKRQFQYVIGIDLGHGETSAAICPLQWDSPSTDLDPVKDLEMGGNKKVIPSALTVLDDGTAYVGDAAYNPEVLKKATVRVGFKKVPNDLNGEAEQTMTRFMHEIYLRIRENNQALLQDGNHLVYIATPSGWTKEQQELYVKMAEQAGLPMGGVTKESRAAFVKAQQDTTSGLSQNLHKGAIVFDMGSSTLDFTYMNGDLSNLIDYGYDCGASLIDKAIYEKKREEFPSIQVFEQKYPKLVDYLIAQARAAKEKVYFDPSLPYKKTINFEDIIEDVDLEDERFKFNFQPGELDDLLREKGYFKKVEDAMIDYKNNKISGLPIFGVFLTGGASRMDFLRDMICRCWDVTPEQLFRDTDPSLTISRGVAEVARIDLRTEGGDQTIAQEIAKVQQHNTIFEHFAKNYGVAVSKEVCDTIKNTVKSYCDATTDESMNFLKVLLRQEIGKCKSKIEKEAVPYLQAEIDAETDNVQKAVDDLVRAYAKQGTNVEVPALRLSSLNMGSINLDHLISEIADQVVKNSITWLDVGVMGGLGLLAWLCLGVPGLIAGAVYMGWEFLSSLGKDEAVKKAEKEAKKKEAMERLLSKNERQKFWKSFVEKWESEGMEASLNNDIVKAVAQNDKIKSEINIALKAILDDYKKELRNARLLID